MSSELKWKTPVPQLGWLSLSPEGTHGFLLRLVQWLREQEQEAEDDLEAILAFGGLGVAEKMYGFEGVFTPSAPDTTEILSAPTGSQKKVVVGLHVHQAGLAGTYNVVKNKNSSISIIVSMDSSVLDHEEVCGRHKTGYIVLDATDESLEIRTLVGNNSISYSGSYVLVD